MKVKISQSSTQSQIDEKDIEIDLSLTTRRGSEYFIGRSPDSDLVLDSEDVSRQHGKFFYQSGNYYFSDLGSRNGTIINGKLAEKNHSYILKNGDIIRIGDFVLILEEDISASEQSETVVRIINPSVFSNWKSSQNPSVSGIVPPASELVNQPQEASESIISESKEIYTSGESTFVQSDEALISNSPNIVIPDNAVELQVEGEAADVISDESVDSETPVKEEATANISGFESEYTIVQVNDVLKDIIYSDAPEAVATQTPEADVAEAISPENPLNFDAPEAVATQTPEAEVAEVISPEDSLNSDVPEAVATQTPEGDVQEAESNNLILNTSTTEDGGEELVSDTTSISTSELVNEELKVVGQETQQEAEENISEEQSVIEIAKILEDKQIILISHDTKKNELTELVAEHEKFLSYCLTRTWQTFSDYIYRETGLSVTQEIPPATSGGYQAINSLINSGEIIAVIFLRDFLVPQPGQASEEALLRTCNVNEILLATNLPTAQAVIHYLKNLKDS